MHLHMHCAKAGPRHRARLKTARPARLGLDTDPGLRMFLKRTCRLARSGQTQTQVSCALKSERVIPPGLVREEKGGGKTHERFCRVAGSLCVTGCFLTEAGLSTCNQRLLPRSRTVFRHRRHCSRAPHASQRQTAYGMASQRVKPITAARTVNKRNSGYQRSRQGSSGSPAVS